jgi:hypothetical protein
VVADQNCEYRHQGGELAVGSEWTAAARAAAGART